jgi:nitrogen fixation NifU-like protein
MTKTKKRTIKTAAPQNQGTCATIPTSLPPAAEFPLEAFYTPEVMDHFLHPHHVGVLADYDVVGEVGNIVCGDVMRIYLKIEPDDDEKLCIANISFETYGCGAAIATSSITTDLAFGQTLEEALKITKDLVIKKLVKLPAQKIHCSILAVDALHEAIYQYYQQNKLRIPVALEKQHQTIQKQKEYLKKQYESWLT